MTVEIIYTVGWGEGFLLPEKNHTPVKGRVLKHIIMIKHENGITMRQLPDLFGRFNAGSFSGNKVFCWKEIKEETEAVQWAPGVGDISKDISDIYMTRKFKVQVNTKGVGYTKNITKYVIKE